MKLKVLNKAGLLNEFKKNWREIKREGENEERTRPTIRSASAF